LARKIEDNQTIQKGIKILGNYDVRRERLWGKEGIKIKGWGHKIIDMAHTLHVPQPLCNARLKVLTLKRGPT
jgi:hypothetical protein